MNEKSIKQSLLEFRQDSILLNQKNNELLLVNNKIEQINKQLEIINYSKNKNILIKEKESLINNQYKLKYEINELVNKKILIETMINKLSQLESNVLKNKYIDNLSIIEISHNLNYSYQRVYQIHSKAIKRLANINA